MDANKDLRGRIFTEELNILIAALNATANAIVITDHLSADEPIVFCNIAFEKLTGYELKNVIGKNCRFLQGKETETDARMAIKEALDKGEPCSVQMLNYRIDGFPFHNKLQLLPIADLGGRITHFIGTQTQVNTIDDLEYRHNLNGFTEDAMALTSHELRTPLTNLKGSLQLLARIFEEGKQPLMQKMLMDISHANLEKLIHVIEVLLTDHNQKDK